MPKVTAFLDCGCAILEDGARVRCPTCDAALTAPPITPRQLCSYHPDVDYRHAWGCPQCLADLRGELSQLQEAAAFAGNTIRNGKPYESLDDDERHALDWLNILLPSDMGDHQ